MVPLLVFYLHIVAVAWAFTQRWQDEGLSEGMLAVFFVALIFFVGWSIVSFLVRLVIPPAGFGLLLDRDALALLLLTVTEGFFYYFYLRGDSGAASGGNSVVEGPQ
jgi:hypothetical protein